MTAPQPFDPGLRGIPVTLVHDDGTAVELPVQRWTATPDSADQGLLLDGCTGPTLDLGCGPGRLVTALSLRGIAALGVDSSRLAVTLAGNRGALVLHRDLFGRLPAEGRWSHVLLADGNIGIGGDPVRLLRRAAGLLRRNGTAMVELESPGVGLRRGRASVWFHGRRGPWFPWARVGVEALPALARSSGLLLREIVRHHDRWAGVLARR